MSTEKHITASCVISNNIVFKNRETVFETAHTTLHNFLLAVYNNFGINYPKFYKMDSLSKLGWLASEVLLKGSFVPSDYAPAEIGIVLSNANASLDTDFKYIDTVKDIASPSVFVYTLPNIVMGEICIRNNFKGENAFFVSEAFDAEFIQQYVSNLIDNNIVKACICGWVDLLGEDYKAVLYLVEKDGAKPHALFTSENITNTFNAGGR